MRYLFLVETTQPGLIESLKEAKNEIGALMEQIKPEAIYFSTIRRLLVLVVNVDDPHVELRYIFENLSKWGQVTIDPVSTLEEFSAFLESI
jgi:hypothetical protein